MVEPCEDLYKRVRARLVLAGKTFNALASEHGIARQNARKALTGEWRGPRAREVVRLLVQEAGLEHPSR